MISTLLLVLGLFSSLGASVVRENGLSFSSVNVTLNSQNHDFSFRKVSFTAIPILNIASYSSVAFKVDGEETENGGSVDASVDAVIGLASFPPVSLIPIDYSPTIWMAYFSADVSVDITNIGVDSKVDASGGFCAQLAYKIEEINPSGEVVETHLLKRRGYSPQGVQTAGDGHLKYITYVSDDDGFVVSITLAASAILGKLQQGGTITPKSMESFVEIENYPYANPANHLRLTIYLAHFAKSRSSTFSATNTVIAGSGEEQVYFHLSSEAMIDGENGQVTISGMNDVDIAITDVDNQVLQAKLQSAGSMKAEVRRVAIDFPAGAVSISYDPGMGFGAPDSAAFLIPSFSLFFFSVLAALFLF